MGVPEVAFVDEVSPSGPGPFEMPDDATNRDVPAKPEAMGQVTHPDRIGKIIEPRPERSGGAILFPAGSEFSEPSIAHAAVGGVPVEEKMPSEDEMMGMKGDIAPPLDLFDEFGKAIVIPRQEVEIEMGKVASESGQPLHRQRDRFGMRSDGPAKVEGISVQDQGLDLMEIVRKLAEPLLALRTPGEQVQV